MARLFLILALTIAALPATAPRAWAADKGFYEGLQAFNAGQFNEAAGIWAPLAQGGDAKSENSLGLLYYTGFGVERDYDRARGLFLSAAEQGVVQAQMFLALMYYKGDGVKRDNKIAYVWSDIADTAGFAEAANFRAMLADALSPGEIEEARQLAAEWRAYYARH